MKETPLFPLSFEELDHWINAFRGHGNNLTSVKTCGNCFLLLPAMNEMYIDSPLLTLFVLAIPVACVAWTVTHEEVFREPRTYFVRKSQNGRSLLTRKFFYLFTCEYCFSHYVTILFLVLTNFRLLFDDWRGYVISGFALVWIANVYMSLYALIKVDIKKDRIIMKREEKLVKQDRETAAPRH